MANANKSVYHLEPQGSTIERAIINTLNFLTDIVIETIVKPNGEKLDKNVNDTENLKTERTDNLEQLLDTQFELEQAKDDIVNSLEAQLDLEFRVSQLEDSIGG